MPNETETSNVAPALWAGDLDLIDWALKCLQVVVDQKAAYDEINKAIATVQGGLIDNPFLLAMDEKVEVAVSALLDHILGDEIATYFLCEVPVLNGEAFFQHHDRRWPLRTVEDVGIYVRERNALAAQPATAVADVRATRDECVARLAEAGSILLTFPGNEPIRRHLEESLVRTAIEEYARVASQTRDVPSFDQISRMDEALGWINLIPQDRYVVRIIVGARCVVDPVTRRHVISWKWISRTLGADETAIKRWHSQGIDMIVQARHRAAAQKDAKQS